MRKQILMSAAAAFALSSLAAAGVAVADTPGVKAEARAAKESNPVVSDKIISKYEAKDARRQARVAHHKAKVAAHDAKVVAKTARKARKAPNG